VVTAYAVSLLRPFAADLVGTEVVR